MSVKNKLNAFFIKNPPFFDFYFFILNKLFFPIPLPVKTPFAGNILLQKKFHKNEMVYKFFASICFPR